MIEGVRHSLSAMRRDFTALGLPIDIRLHGAPSCAPKIAPAPFGSTCFRGPAGYYVEIRHLRPVSEADYDRIAAVRDLHSTVVEISFYAGPDGRPVKEN